MRIYERLKRPEQIQLESDLIWYRDRVNLILDDLEKQAEHLQIALKAIDEQGLSMIKLQEENRLLRHYLRTYDDECEPHEDEIAAQMAEKMELQS